MARYGFSGTPDDTKIFILFLLGQCPGPVSPQELQALVMMDENADYFVYSDALADLSGRGLVLVGEDGFLSPTERAREHAGVTANELPVSLRKQAAAELALVRQRILRDAAVRAELEPGDGCTVRLAWSDTRGMLIELRLAAGSEEQAKALIAGWKKNAEKIYESVIVQLLT